MFKKNHTWLSSNLSKEMELTVYGHFGFALLMFPVFTDNSSEYEENGTIDAISHIIQKGKCRVITLQSVNHESWLNEKISAKQRSKRHFEYNNYIIEEVIPFVFQLCGGPVPIITAGASLGAYHAANKYFRRPDIFYGVIAMSGTYNIDHLAKGYFDDNCYFNSPVHYLPNLNDSYWLSYLISKHHVHIVSGTGDGEYPDNSRHLSQVLNIKNIPHNVDLWGPEWGHNWKTWNTMLPHYLESKF